MWGRRRHSGERSESGAIAAGGDDHHDGRCSDDRAFIVDHDHDGTDLRCRH